MRSQDLSGYRRETRPPGGAFSQVRESNTHSYSNFGLGRRPGCAGYRLPGRNRRSGLVSELSAHFGKTRIGPRLMAGSLSLAGFAVMSQLVRRPHTIYSTFPWRGYPCLPPIRAARERGPAQLDTGRGFYRSGSARSPAHRSAPGTPRVGHGLPLDAGEEFPTIKTHVAVNLDHIPPRQCRRRRHLPGPRCPRPRKLTISGLVPVTHDESPAVARDPAKLRPEG